ncbi:hypothetical protein HDU97_001021 [Phlyctochytrium planicorne]|nr:hypothetical protein HDU97_001021 [Phlyctochytrium planicorne]
MGETSSDSSTSSSSDDDSFKSHPRQKDIEAAMRSTTRTSMTRPRGETSSAGLILRRKTSQSRRSIKEGKFSSGSVKGKEANSSQKTTGGFADNSKGSVMDNGKRNSVAAERNILRTHSSAVDARLGKSLKNFATVVSESPEDENQNKTLGLDGRSADILRNLLHGSPSMIGSSLSISAQQALKVGATPLINDGWSGPPHEKGCIVTRTRGRRVVNLYMPGDVVMFDRIAVWKMQNPTKSIQDAWDGCVLDSLGRTKRFDALLKLQYGVERYDYILKYSCGNVQYELMRRQFEKKLMKKGLLIEKEQSIEDPKETFLKILTPFVVLCHEAQCIKLKLPVEEVTGKEEEDLNYETCKKDISEETVAKRQRSPMTQCLLDLCRPLYDDKQDITKQAAIFQRKRLQFFKGGDASKSSPLYIQLKFFRDSHRSLLTFSLISKIEIKVKNSSGKVSRKEGIGQLLEQNVYTAMFHLHDDEYAFPDRPVSLRSSLRKQWVQTYFTFQPLDDISAYFGEKVALYFAYIGFYNRWLILPAFFGILVTLYGLKEATTQKTSPFEWSRIFDNALTPWFSLFISSWVTVLPSIWKRQTNSLAWRWSTNDFEQIEVKRPQFKATSTRRNPVTGKQELFFSAKKRLVRQSVSWLFILFCMLIAGGITAVEIIGGAILAVKTRREGETAVIICAIGLVGVILIKKPFRAFAQVLNEWENYRTESNYDDAIILKTYALDFVIHYTLLFYFAIVKPNLRYSGTSLFPELKDGCSVIFNEFDKLPQCSASLTISILVLFLGGQIIERFEELVIPWVISKWAEIVMGFRMKMRWREMVRERKRQALANKDSDPVASAESGDPEERSSDDATASSNPISNLNEEFSLPYPPIDIQRSDTTSSAPAAAQSTANRIPVPIPSLQIVISGSRESGLVQSVHTVNEASASESSNPVNTKIVAMSANASSPAMPTITDFSITDKTSHSIANIHPPVFTVSEPSKPSHDEVLRRTFSLNDGPSAATSLSGASGVSSTSEMVRSISVGEKSAQTAVSKAVTSPQNLTPDEKYFLSLSSMSTDEYVEHLSTHPSRASSAIHSQAPNSVITKVNHKAKLAKMRLPQFYRDDKLVPSEGIRDEFAQKVMQLGYIAMFACSFPLAPCFALLNNVYEVRTDAFKLMTIYQRPLPARAKDIGIWFNILRFLAHASVLTNSAIIAFNSPAFEEAFLSGFDDIGSKYAARFTFIIAFHYSVHILVTSFLLLVPEMPKSVELAMARAAYLDRVRRGNEVEEEDERLSISSLEVVRRSTWNPPEAEHED